MKNKKKNMQIQPRHVANVILSDGSLLLKDEWVEMAFHSRAGFIFVEDDGYYNCSVDNKTLVWKGNFWPRIFDDFKQGLARIYMEGRGYNFVKMDGTLLQDKWFSECSEFVNGHANVQYNGKNMKLSKTGKLTK